MNERVIAGFADAKAALATPEFAQALYDEGAQVMADALITLQGDAHRKRRITEFGVFKRGFFRHYEQSVFPAALTPTLRPYLAAGHADLIQFGYRVTMNLTADFAGIDRTGSAEDTEALLKLVRTFSEGATLVHSTRDHDVVRREVDLAMTAFESSYLNPSKARRLALIEEVERGELDREALPNDVMTTLLLNRERLPLADDVFRREIAFYLQAGAHSTANAMIRALHEIFTWRDANPEQWQVRRHDPLFVQRCVHESLRLNPSSPVAWRRPSCPISFGDDRLDERDRVVIDLRQANRDREVFGEDADTFDPERAIPNGAWPWGLSFGYGVHACMGRDLDGGIAPKPDTDPAEHQFGIVTLLVQKLLDHGARWDPDNPPETDAGTVRATWSRYPVLLEESP